MTKIYSEQSDNLQSQTRHCYHGGAFFEAIGSDLQDLSRHHHVINADVLDAWFPPAPGVLEALKGELPWLARTSPPTHCEGMIKAIAEARQLSAENIVPGSGSSDLIFRALGSWLTSHSQVLMLDPCYGEYGHVCEEVIGCQVHRLPLDSHNDFKVQTKLLAQELRKPWDLVILIHPNNPTGQHMDRSEMAALLNEIPKTTRCWIDEAYIEYTGTDQSLESLAANSSNIFVCKSFSKVYALSGMRAAYLTGPIEEMARLRRLTPPWVVSLPAQLSAIKALEDPAYYQSCYQETHILREELAQDLVQHFPGSQLCTGVANWVLWTPPVDPAEIDPWVLRCRERNLFIRSFHDPHSPLSSNTLRISVKDRATQQKIIKILTETQPLTDR